MALIGWSPAPALAEGSAQVGTTQGLLAATVIRVDILNVGEVISWTSNSGGVVITNPSNTQVVNSNSTTGTYTTVTTGTFTFAYKNNQGQGAWDIAVSGTAAGKGRVHSPNWQYDTGSFSSARANNGSYYALVPGGLPGTSGVVELKLDGLSGYQFTIGANRTGVNGVNAGRSVSTTGNTFTPSFEMYMLPPQISTYDPVQPTVANYTFVAGAKDCNLIVPGTTTGTFRFSTNVNGTYHLVCDLDKDTLFNRVSASDLLIVGTTTIGANSVTWDGKNNAGVNVATGSYNCRVYVNTGELHFVGQDIETSYEGLRLFTVSSSLVHTPLTMFWNDTAIQGADINMPAPTSTTGLPTSGAAGIDSGSYATAAVPNVNAHSWGNFNASGSGSGDGKGQNTFIDTFGSILTVASTVASLTSTTTAADSDTDGLGNYLESCTLGTNPNSTDSDMDGLGDNAETNGGSPIDTDMDGTIDALDTDSDNDGSPDSTDNNPRSTSSCADTDADGCDDCAIVHTGAGSASNDGLDQDADGECNKGDNDDDNDGIADSVELGGTDLSIDSDNDGILDYRDSSRVTCTDTSPNNGICDTLPTSVDQDGDTVPNHLDRDSDADGITDAREAGGTDANGDGMPDGCLPVNAIGSCVSGLIASPVNSDSPSDTVRDYLDTDSDADAVSDYNEAYDTDSNGTANTAKTNLDADADGIDNAFDPSCSMASPCAGVVGNPVVSPLSAARDSDGNGTPDWLQVCGDAYVAAAEACDDGNTVSTDACNNSCKRGTGVSCTAGTQCATTMCDPTLNTCQSCLNSVASGTDSGCSASTPTCRAVSGTNMCLTCADTATGLNTDDGCGGSTRLCNAAGNGGLGVCQACVTAAHCNDGNACTSDSCGAGGTCSNGFLGPTTPCAGGVCDGTAAATCVACVNTAGAGGVDSGCSAATPACDTSGASPVCRACMADGDCASGVCSNNACVTCVNDQPGSGTDRGCGGAAPMCNAAANGGLGACVACVGAADCNDGKACTDDSCNAGGSCVHTSDASNTCSSGVCDGTAAAQCVACVDDSVGGQDRGCSAASALCDTSGAAPVCVECLGSSDCGSGEFCNASQQCVPGCGANSDCDVSPAAPLCHVGSATCVECLVDADCPGIEECAGGYACSLPDSDDDGVSDDADDDDDNDGIPDTAEGDGDDLSVDSDADGIPDYRDPQVVSCADTTPLDGDCDTLPASVDTDGDGTPNHLDRDSDDDGLTDARESGGTDGDGDGIADGCLPVDANGACSTGLVNAPVNTDGPADALHDYLDPDSDGDGLTDQNEAFDSDGDGVADVAPADADGDGDGIDDAFDPSCAAAPDCGGAIGVVVEEPLTATQDSDGDGTPDWLQVCGDAYATGSEACDDGNAVGTDTCTNACLRGTGVSCTTGAQCSSSTCDATLNTCQGCTNSIASGTDTGCSGAAPTCVTVSGTNVCVVCADDQTGLAADDGCTGSAMLCDATAAGGAGACVACIGNADCDDGNACTTDSCGGGNTCTNSSLAAGAGCGSGVCDGAGACVECVSGADCDDGDACTDDSCSAGSCAHAVASACAPSCASDSDCAGMAGTPACDVAHNECVECVEDSDCKGEQICVTGFQCRFQDSDHDGLPDDVDIDDDADGIEDVVELGGDDLSNDDDADGIPDYRDADEVDCSDDGTSGECDTLPVSIDVDHDGVPNHLDLDSDADGGVDATEGHDTDFDGQPEHEPVGEDSDGDGLDDAFDADCDTVAACGGLIGVPAPLPDCDEDDVPNYLDVDDDGDERVTKQERSDAEEYEGDADSPSDVDGDGLLNWYDVDSDADDALDTTENTAGGDVDDDGTLDYLDPAFRASDTDGDGVLDLIECPAPGLPSNDDCMDSDVDGTPDYLDVDDDQDGVLTATELDVQQGRDADADGKPNYLDTDDDNDRVLTSEELDDAGNTMDTDDDGTPDYLDVDDDDDGLPTTDELAEDLTFLDTDGDSLPNHRDADDDGDGIDTTEERPDGDDVDTDGDGIPNYLESDDDGDGIPTADEPRDENDDGIADHLQPPTNDGTLAGGALCSVQSPGADTGDGTFALLPLLLLVGWRRRLQRWQAGKGAAASPRAIAALTLLLAALLGSSRAQAQVAVDQFKPAPLASGGFGVGRPDVLKPMSWGAVVMLDYANDPLVYEAEPGDPDSAERVISDHLVLHLGGALGLWDRFTVFTMLPVHLVMTGDDNLTVSASEPEGAGIGDLALGGRYLLLGTGRSRGALAAEFVARLPTAQLANDSQAYSGDLVGSYEPAMIAEYRAGPFDVRARLGARLRKPTTVGNLQLDQELVYGLGARYRLADALYAHAELYGSTFFNAFFEREQSPLEMLLGAKYQPGDFNFGAAAGPGLLPGYGSPDVRVVATVGYARVEKHEKKVPDTDRDGLLDPNDECPLDPEDKDGFQDAEGCSDPDNDKDGILDVSDECPMEPEDQDEFEDSNGCPDPDNDADSILDVSDECPLEPEDQDEFEDPNGCPDPDNDKDGIVDAEDQCPLEPEDLDGFEDAEGCPEPGEGLVKVTCDKIDIKDKVFFDSSSDNIQARSFELLDQVAAVLEAAAHIKLLRIEGHTDDRGNDAKNLDLSKRRAASVVRYLMEKGIDPTRLASDGFGETKPIADNKTEAGRGENRRVEFVIVEQDSSGCSDE